MVGVRFDRTSRILAALGLCVLVNGWGYLWAQPASCIQEANWLQIKNHLDTTTNNISFDFIQYEVEAYCASDTTCLINSYDYLIYKLERQFNLPAAIFVCEQVIEITEKSGNLKEKADAYSDLSRFYDVMGNDRLAHMYMGMAIPIYEQLGSQLELLTSRMYQLEFRAKYEGLTSVMPDMNQLLAETIEKQDSAGIHFLRLRLLHYCLSLDDLSLAEDHIQQLDRLAASNPDNNSLNNIIHRGKGEIARLRSDLENAAKYYRMALENAKAEPDRWMEISNYHQLAWVAFENDQKRYAQKLLDTARQKALTLNLNDLLIENYTIGGEIAESEEDFATALEHYKNRDLHKALHEEERQGFDPENYYLQLEKDQLSVEKKNQQLQLDLRESQLKYSYIILGLGTLLGLGLLIGLYKQYQGKKELRRQNNIIEAQSRQLHNLDEAKSRFFTNVSHELRTPLTLILGPIRSLLSSTDLNEPQNRLLRTVEKNTRQLQQLVSEILDLQKLETGNLQTSTNPTDFKPFFRQYFSQFDSYAQRKRIQYSWEVDCEDDEKVIELDQSKTRQIILNLLSNAFKFTPENERIQARAEFNDGQVKITVRDTGPGIHPDDLPHLFDRFFQTTQPEKAVDGGTGIGLALCKQYAELFGGNISVKSDAGQGTEFIVRFPVPLSDIPADMLDQKTFRPESVSTKHLNKVSAHDPPDLASDQKLSPTGANGHSREQILVVEDNLDLQDYICSVLSEKYIITTADNGREALKQIKSNKTPSLILSDLMMPIMDGFQLLEKLKGSDSTRHIPVIMLTARTGQEDKLKALRIGVDDYMPKPFDAEELHVRIENLLNNYRSRKDEDQAIDSKIIEEEPPTSEADKDWLEQFEQFVAAHLSDDILNVPILADEFAMSESTLLRQLKRLTGLTPAQYLREMRLEAARRILERGAVDSVSKIAVEVGYKDARSFSRSFKKRFGKLPSEVLD